MSFTDGRFTGGRHNARFGLMDLPDLALVRLGFRGCEPDRELCFP